MSKFYKMGKDAGSAQHEVFPAIKKHRKSKSGEEKKEKNFLIFFFWIRSDQKQLLVKEISRFWSCSEKINFSSEQLRTVAGFWSFSNFFLMCFLHRKLLKSFGSWGGVLGALKKILYFFQSEKCSAQLFFRKKGIRKL